MLFDILGAPSFFVFCFGFFFVFVWLLVGYVVLVFLVWVAFDYVIGGEAEIAGGVLVFASSGLWSLFLILLFGAFRGGFRYRFGDFFLLFGRVTLFFVVFCFVQALFLFCCFLFTYWAFSFSFMIALIFFLIFFPLRSGFLSAFGCALFSLFLDVVVVSFFLFFAGAVGDLVSVQFSSLVIVVSLILLRVSSVRFLGIGCVWGSFLGRVVPPLSDVKFSVFFLLGVRVARGFLLVVLLVSCVLWGVLVCGFGVYFDATALSVLWYGGISFVGLLGAFCLFSYDPFVLLVCSVLPGVVVLVVPTFFSSLFVGLSAVFLFLLLFLGVFLLSLVGLFCAVAAWRLCVFAVFVAVSFPSCLAVGCWLAFFAATWASWKSLAFGSWVFGRSDGFFCLFRFCLSAVCLLFVGGLVDLWVSHFVLILW